jgi:nucleoside-diphosphate-sugar epimerase
MKALVTGAAGFIGSHLTGTLLDRGAQVTGLDCFTDYYARSIKEANLAHNQDRAGFQFVEARLQDVDLPGLLDGVTHVFHLAAQAGVRKSWGRDFRTYTDNNVDASQRLLEACVGLPLHRFVYASSSSIYGDNAAIPMREDALPQPVTCITRIMEFRPRRSDISRYTGPDSAPTWASTGSSEPQSRGTPSPSTAMASRPAISHS